jgi:hypothetical protein
MCIKCFQTVSPLEIHWHVPQYDSGESCRHSPRCHTISISHFQRKGIIKYFIVGLNSKDGMWYIWPYTVLGSLWKKFLVVLGLNSGPQACLATALLFVPLCQNFLCWVLFFWYWGQNSGPNPLPSPPNIFSIVGYFDIRPPELFAWTGFKTWSSCSAPWLCRFTALSH